MLNLIVRINSGWTKTKVNLKKQVLSKKTLKNLIELKDLYLLNLKFYARGG